MDADQLVLGIDPDSHNTAWCVASLKQVIALGVVRGPLNQDHAGITMLRYSGLALELILKKHQVELAVVEGQHIHYGQAAPPADILKLAQIAGGLAGQIALLSPPTKLLIAQPADWKGQTPKRVNQARSFNHYGILAEQGKDYCVPTGCVRIAKVEGFGALRKGDWKHVGDAVGLALHGARLLQPC